MSDKDQTSDFAHLLDVMDLKPIKLEPMPFGQFLEELAEHPERAETAHGLLVRAVESLGEVDIESEPEERQQYLRMLKQLGIKLYKAFDHVRGSQRMAHQQMQHLRAAAANGYQLFLALIIKGPPGSGKSMFVDAFKRALEGQEVFTVEGCPVHENPINLLKLLSEETLNRLAHALGLDDESVGEAEDGILRPTLHDMLAVAGDPCQHCWTRVMDSGHNDPNKALLNLKVVPMRLSSRHFGIATWTADSGLTAALRNGSRGMVDMGELFDDGTPLSNPLMSGSVRKVLAEATNDRRIPGLAAEVTTGEKDEKSSGAPVLQTNGTSYQPLDAVLFGQANEGAWDSFIQSLGKDGGKFTRRFHVFTYPYNTSVTEEVQAYRDRISLMKEVPHFDPQALTLLALLAIISRLKQHHQVDIIERARIYDGERLKPAVAGQTGEYWTVEKFWQEAGEREALTGLDMTVMFNILAELTKRALTERSFEGCVSSYEMIAFLRNRLRTLSDSDGFTDSQRQVIKTALETFLAPPDKNGKLGAIEAEYRRILQRELFEVAAPDFSDRAEKLFQRYRRHVEAINSGAEIVEEDVDDVLGGAPHREKVPVDNAFVEDIENWMGIKTRQEREKFRTSLEAEIFSIHRKRTQQGEEFLTETWETLPQIADGIRNKLNKETQDRLEKLLRSDFELQVAPEDAELRDRMMAAFTERGYCNHCLRQALEYFKLNRLWTLQS